MSRREVQEGLRLDLCLLAVAAVAEVDLLVGSTVGTVGSTARRPSRRLCSCVHPCRVAVAPDELVASHSKLTRSYSPGGRCHDIGRSATCWMVPLTEMVRRPTFLLWSTMPLTVGVETQPTRLEPGAPANEARSGSRRQSDTSFGCATAALSSGEKADVDDVEGREGGEQHDEGRRSLCSTLLDSPLDNPA